MSFPATIVRRLIGNVNKVSSVLFSFSMPMDESTIPPVIIITIIMMMGTIIDCEVSIALNCLGLILFVSIPFMEVVTFILVGCNAVVGSKSD